MCVRIGKNMQEQLRIFQFRRSLFEKLGKNEVSTFQVHWMVDIGHSLDRMGQSYPGQTISGLQMAQIRHHFRLKFFQRLLPGKS